VTAPARHRIDEATLQQNKHRHDRQHDNHCCRLRFAYLLERGRLGVSVRTRVSRCKNRKKMVRPARFERVTFAFGANA